MKSLRFLDRRAGYSLASLGLLLGMVVPSVFPAFASADLISSRSIEMSSSVVSQTGVTYTVQFTTAHAYQTLVMDFCKDTPIIGESCAPPDGMDVTNAAASYTAPGGGIGTITNAHMGVNHLELDGTSSATAGVNTFTLSGITNPAAVSGFGSTFFARIYTYTSGTATSNGWSNASTLGTTSDTGGIALATTLGIGVSAVVKESMVFCVSGTNGTTLASGPSGNCGADNADDTTGATGLTDPSITLGHGAPAALDTTAIDSASDWAQLSTNASSGAVVRMTNTNSGNCNGLFRAGGTVGTCDIAGSGSNAITFANGDAKFGLGLAAATDAPNSVAPASGTITLASGYNGGAGSVSGTDSTLDHFGMGAGVTSTYGDQIFSSTTPVANRNIGMTFAAGAAPTTPAGKYSATMNLIATGTF